MTARCAAVLWFVWLACVAGCDVPVGVNEPVPEETLLLAGAGATFPAPLYGRWIARYGEEVQGVQVRYASVGSGRGEQYFLAGELPRSLVSRSGVNEPPPSPVGQLARPGEPNVPLHFGASDAGLSEQKRSAVERGAAVIPVAAGSIVVAYNLPGIDSLQLPRDVYPDIFLGKITEWNDERIQKANPGVSLPRRTIAVVTRLDSSGTTFAFTNHLAAISPAWREKYGDTGRKQLDWPGLNMRGFGNTRVAGMVQGIPYSIGYVEFGLAQRAALSMARLQNRAGKYVEPTMASGQAALENAALDESLRLPDPPGEDSYPIVTYTWLLLYRQYDEPDVAANIRQFVTWCLTDGQVECEPLGYLQLSDSIRQQALADVQAIED